MGDRHGASGAGGQRAVGGVGRAERRGWVRDLGIGGDGVVLFVELWSDWILGYLMEQIQLKGDRKVWNVSISVNLEY